MQNTDSVTWMIPRAIFVFKFQEVLESDKSSALSEMSRVKVGAVQALKEEMERKMEEVRESNEKERKEIKETYEREKKEIKETYEKEKKELKAHWEEDTKKKLASSEKNKQVSDNLR